MSRFMCRTCLYTNANGECFKNVETVKKILKQVVPEVTFVPASLVCFRCYNFLKTVENFKLTCIEVQKQLIDFNVEQLRLSLRSEYCKEQLPISHLLVGTSGSSNELQEHRKTVIIKNNAHNYQGKLEEYIKKSLKTTSSEENKAKGTKTRQKRVNLVKTKPRTKTNNSINAKRAENVRFPQKSFEQYQHVKEMNNISQELFHVHSDLDISPVSTSNPRNLHCPNSYNLIYNGVPKEIESLKKKSEFFQRLKKRLSKQMSSHPHEFARISREVESNIHLLVNGSQQKIMGPIDLNRIWDKASEDLMYSNPDPQRINTTCGRNFFQVSNEKPPQDMYMPINTSYSSTESLIESAIVDRLLDAEIDLSSKDLNVLNCNVPIVPEMYPTFQNEASDLVMEFNRFSQDELSKSFVNQERISQEFCRNIEDLGEPNQVTSAGRLCLIDKEMTSEIVIPNSNQETQILPESDVIVLSDVEVELNDSSKINTYEENLDEDDIFEENKITIVKNEPEPEENPSFFNKCSDSGFYICKLCAKKYKHSKGLYEHTQANHSELKFYHCEVCNFFTLWKSALSRHESLFHETADVLVLDYKYCYHCTYKTTSKHVLAKHIHNNHFTKTVLEV